MLTSLIPAFLLFSTLAQGTPVDNPQRSLADIFPRQSLVSSCPSSGAISCHNSSSVGNLCCFEAPGVCFSTSFVCREGILKWYINRDCCYRHKFVNCCVKGAYTNLVGVLQFWDTNPSTGPSNSWTIHGKTSHPYALMTGL